MKNPSCTYSSRDRSSHLHSFTNLSEYEKQGSAVISHGEGIYLCDTDGKKYLDAMSSLWCATLGYSEKRLAEVAATQLSVLPYSHTFRGRTSEKLVELAEKIVHISPDHLSKVFFAGSGSEANESAVKIAWSYHKHRGNPDKRKVISRINGYHGSTIFATRLSGMPSMHQYMNLDFPEVLYADCPNHQVQAQDGESEEEFATRMAINLENLITTEGPETIAAFIAEPVMGVGGVILPPKTYFEKIQAILKKHNILFIADEVICGFGRTGYMFGSTTFNLTPDLLTVAKGITSAYFPMSATLITQDIYLALVQATKKSGVFTHGFTYSGHPVGAAMALETIAILEEREIPDNARIQGERLLLAMQDLYQFPIIRNVRGIGLMAAFDIYANPGKRELFSGSVGVGTLLMDIAERNGLFIRAVGDTIVMAPPLIISQSEIDQMIELLKESTSELMVLLEKENLIPT